MAVQLRGVHKTFVSVEAVRGVDLTMRSGEIVAFLGPNGAGKTSTIDMILASPNRPAETSPSSAWRRDAPSRRA
jgi:ABC-2 type transport system ATP-binding protein